MGKITFPPTDHFFMAKWYKNGIKDILNGNCLWLSSKKEKLKGISIYKQLIKDHVSHLSGFQKAMFE